MIDVSQATVILLILSMLTGLVLLVGILAFFGLFVRRQYPTTATEEGEEPAIEPDVRAKRSAAYRQGALVLLGLAVLTVAEYTIAVYWPSVVLILIMNLFKAGLIIQYFMHVSRLWSEEAH